MESASKGPRARCRTVATGAVWSCVLMLSGLATVLPSGHAQAAKEEREAFDEQAERRGSLLRKLFNTGHTTATGVALTAAWRPETGPQLLGWLGKLNELPGGEHVVAAVTDMATNPKLVAAAQALAEHPVATTGLVGGLALLRSKTLQVALRRTPMDATAVTAASTGVLLGHPIMSMVALAGYVAVKTFGLARVAGGLATTAKQGASAATTGVKKVAKHRTEGASPQLKGSGGPSRVRSLLGRWRKH